MSCKYCELKRRKDDDVEWVAGEDWESDSDDGGYICPNDDGFRMLVYYDARCACTAVDNIKYCPFCGAKLAMPKEPPIKDEKNRKVVRAWLEANDLDGATFHTSSHFFHYWTLRGFNDNGMGVDIDFFLTGEGIPNLIDGKYYTKFELCGEEEE